MSSSRLPAATWKPREATPIETTSRGSSGATKIYSLTPRSMPYTSRFPITFIVRGPWPPRPSGKHVLCEKPLVLTLEEMDRIETAAQNHNVTIFEAFMYLHHPQTLRLQEMARAGELGQLQSLRSHFSYYLPPDSGNVRLRPEMGGGSLWDVGVYPVSFSVVMANAGAPIEVFGTRRDGETGIDVGFEGLMRFSNDVVAQISCGFRTPREWGATMIGSDSILSIDEPWRPGFDGTVSSVRIPEPRGRSRQTITFSEPDPYVCEVAAMEACILDGATPVVPLKLSRQILSTVLALYESAEIRQPVLTGFS